MPPIIASVLNTPGDGIHLDVVLADLPDGTLTFFASTVPGQPGFEVDAVGAGTTWELDLSSSVEILRHGKAQWRIPIYLKAEDASGIGDEAFEWLCQGSNADILDLLEQQLQMALDVNRPAITRAITIALNSRTWPDTVPIGVEKILRGPAPQIESNGRWPLISVDIFRTDEDLYFGRPYTDLLPISGLIRCMVLHQGQTIWQSVVCAAGMGVMNVLNQIYYLEFRLPTGATVNACHVSSIEVTEEEFGQTDNGAMVYLCEARLNWKGELAAGLIS